MPSMQTLMQQLPERSLRLAEVQQLVPYSKMHIDRLEKRGEFPKRIRLGAGRIVWRMSEIVAWLDAKRHGQKDAA